MSLQLEFNFGRLKKKKKLGDLRGIEHTFSESNTHTHKLIIRSGRFTALEARRRKKKKMGLKKETNTPAARDISTK